LIAFSWSRVRCSAFAIRCARRHEVNTVITASRTSAPPLDRRKQENEEYLRRAQPTLDELPVLVIAVACSDYRPVRFKFASVALDPLANSAGAGKAETLGQGHIEDTRLSLDCMKMLGR
jgi:hypothetical protein